MSESRATSLGATGGLPGANAVPEAAELTPDELADTVGTGDVITTPGAPGLERDVDEVLDEQAARDGRAVRDDQAAERVAVEREEER